MTRNERWGLNVPLDPGPRRRARRTVPLLLGATALLLFGLAARHRLSARPRPAPAAAVAVAPQVAAPPAPEVPDLAAPPGGPVDSDLRDPPPEDGNGS